MQDLCELMSAALETVGPSGLQCTSFVFLSLAENTIQYSFISSFPIIEGVPGKNPLVSLDK